MRKTKLVPFLLAVLLATSAQIVGLAQPTSKHDSPGRAKRHVVDGSESEWVRHAPTMVPGTASYSKGAWSFTDYSYDDKGTGAFAYPSAPGYGANAADPVVLLISQDEDSVHYLVQLNTLISESSTVVALAVDTDNNESTGGGDWPYNAKITTAGWEHVITASGSSATLTSAGESPTPISLPIAVNTNANLMEFSVPLSVADPRGGTWRYRGAAGVWDGNGWAEVVPSSPAAPATSPTGKSNPNHPNAFNLFFRNLEWDGGTDKTDENSSSNFQSSKQAAALASGDLTDFVRSVDFSLIATGLTQITPEPADFNGNDTYEFTRVFASVGFSTTSAEPNGSAEGVTRSGATGRLYNGRFQPYRMFVPSSYREDDRPAPLLPLLHGWTGNHRGFTPRPRPKPEEPPGGDFWNLVVRPNRALVPKPLGRGEEIWYEHLGELDVLEVMDDVARHYNVDPERIYLGGTSMGGLGTIKIAEAHPDIFAGIFPSVPPMSDRATGYAVPAANDWDLVEQADSLRNVPVRNFTGTYDFLVPAGWDSQRFCDRLARLVYDHDCWRDIGTTGQHRGFENDRAVEIAALLSEHTLVHNPARVTYEVHPRWSDQNKAQRIEHLLPYDRVYWVSGIQVHRSSTPEYLDCRARPEDHSCFAEIDIRTWGRGDGDPISKPIPDDPSTTLIRSGLVLSPGPPVESRNHFDATLANVAALDLDLSRMSLSLGRPLTAAITNSSSRTPTLLELGLIASVKNCMATFNGEPLETSVRDGKVTMTLELESGRNDLEISCR